MPLPPQVASISSSSTASTLSGAATAMAGQSTRRGAIPKDLRATSSLDAAIRPNTLQAANSSAPCIADFTA